MRGRQFRDTFADLEQYQSRFFAIQDSIHGPPYDWPLPPFMNGLGASSIPLRCAASPAAPSGERWTPAVGPPSSRFTYARSGACRLSVWITKQPMWTE